MVTTYPDLNDYDTSLTFTTLLVTPNRQPSCKREDPPSHRCFEEGGLPSQMPCVRISLHYSEQHQLRWWRLWVRRDI